MSAVWAGKFQFFTLTRLLAMDHEAAGCYEEPDPWDDGGLIEDNVDPSQPCDSPLGTTYRLCLRPPSFVVTEKAPRPETTVRRDLASCGVHADFAWNPNQGSSEARMLGQGDRRNRRLRQGLSPVPIMMPALQILLKP